MASTKAAKRHAASSDRRVPRGRLPDVPVCSGCFDFAAASQCHLANAGPVTVRCAGQDNTDDTVAFQTL